MKSAHCNCEYSCEKSQISSILIPCFVWMLCTNWHSLEPHPLFPAVTNQQLGSTHQLHCGAVTQTMIYNKTKCTTWCTGDNKTVSCAFLWLQTVLSSVLVGGALHHTSDDGVAVELLWHKVMKFITSISLKQIRKSIQQLFSVFQGCHKSCSFNFLTYFTSPALHENTPPSSHSSENTVPPPKYIHPLLHLKRWLKSSWYKTQTSFNYIFYIQWFFLFAPYLVLIVLGLIWRHCNKLSVVDLWFNLSTAGGRPAVCSLSSISPSVSPHLCLPLLC